MKATHFVQSSLILYEKVVHVLSLDMQYIPATHVTLMHKERPFMKAFVGHSCTDNMHHSSFMIFLADPLNFSWSKIEQY
jgi:hypothetical protein